MEIIQLDTDSEGEEELPLTADSHEYEVEEKIGESDNDSEEERELKEQDNYDLSANNKLQELVTGEPDSDMDSEEDSELSKELETVTKNQNAGGIDLNIPDGEFDIVRNVYVDDSQVEPYKETGSDEELNKDSESESESDSDEEELHLVADSHEYEVEEKVGESDADSEEEKELEEQDNDDLSANNKLQEVVAGESDSDIESEEDSDSSKEPETLTKNHNAGGLDLDIPDGEFDIVSNVYVDDSQVKPNQESDEELNKDTDSESEKDSVSDTNDEKGNEQLMKNKNLLNSSSFLSDSEDDGTNDTENVQALKHKVIKPEYKCAVTNLASHQIFDVEPLDPTSGVKDDITGSEEEDCDDVEYEDEVIETEVTNTLSKPVEEAEELQCKKFQNFEGIDSLASEEEDDDDDDDDLDGEINSLYDEIDIILNKPSESIGPKMAPVTLAETSKRSSNVLDYPERQQNDCDPKRLKKNSCSMKRPAPNDEPQSFMNIKRPKVMENSINCHICINKNFRYSDLIWHLSTSHCSKELFNKYPLKEGEVCLLCQEEGRSKMFKLTKNGKHNYIVHVGKVHLRVLEFLNQELQQQLVSMLKKFAKQGEESFYFLGLATMKNIGEPKLFEETSLAQKKRVEPTYSLPTVDHLTMPSTADALKTMPTQNRNTLPEIQEKKIIGAPQCLDVSNTENRSGLKHAKCSLCTDDKLYSRGQLMTHLTIHFYKDLAIFIGNFPLNEACEYCVMENKTPVFMVKAKNNFIRHVGTVHEKVINFAPQDMVEVLAAMSGRIGNSRQPYKSKMEESAPIIKANPSEFKENAFNLPAGLSLFSASTSMNPDYQIPNGLKITKSRKAFEDYENVVGQVKDLGSNLKIERVFKKSPQADASLLFKCEECSHQSESKSKFIRGLICREAMERRRSSSQVRLL